MTIFHVCYDWLTNVAPDICQPQVVDNQSQLHTGGDGIVTQYIVKMAKVFGFYCEYCKNCYLQFAVIENR